MSEFALHCFAQSGNAYKPALMLELAGADWTPRFVDYFGGETSTPAYRAINVMGEVPVLEHDGWGELHAEANALTKQGRWDELSDLVDDEVLAAFAVVCELAEVGPAFRERFAGLAERITVSLPYETDDLLALDIVADPSCG